MDETYQEKFSNIFKEVMGIENIDNNPTMDNTVQWDSLKHVQLIAELEDEFNINFNYKDIMNMTSVKKILDMLSKYV